jgi:hypothetical protein
MKLNRETKLNAVCYKVPNMNLVLHSFHMNMTADEYIRKSHNIGKSLLFEKWVFVRKETTNSSHTLYFYKCPNGSIVTVDQRL